MAKQYGHMAPLLPHLGPSPQAQIAQGWKRRELQTGLKMCETRISADNFTVCDRLAILMKIFSYGSCFKIGALHILSNL